MMECYEKFRDETGWKSYFNDIAFAHGEAPTAKVISFFCKRKPNDPKVDITKQTIKSVDFDILCDVGWCRFHLDRTLKYKRKWYGDQDIYKFVALQDYISQCENGNFSKCLLSKQEFASLAPKRK